MSHAVQRKRKTKKRRRGLGIVLTLFAILLVLWGAIAFIFFGGSNLLPPLGKPATAYVAEGQVQALTLAPVNGDASEEGLRAYYAEALEFAGQNGINTIIYEGKTGLSVYWRDGIFPPADEVIAHDTFLNKVDPLKILCDAAGGTNIQIWVQADLYSTAGYHSEMNGKAAKLLSGQSPLPTRFAADDANYTKLLLDSLVRLRHNYPISGIVLAGLNTGGETVDKAAWNSAFSNTMGKIQTAFGKSGYATQFSLRFAADDTALVDAEVARSLAASGAVSYLLPIVSNGENLSQRLATWQGEGISMLAAAPEADAEIVFFTAAINSSCKGALLGSYASAKADTIHLGVLRSTFTPVDSTLPVGFDIPQTLQITYPVEGKKLTWANVYITGHSDPSQPLIMNGQEITDRAPNGAFGVFVPLALGDNIFTFQNGDASFVKTITRVEPSPGVSVTPTPDATEEAEPGQVIRFVPSFTNVLTTYNDLSTINEIFASGATAVVQESRVFTYNSRTLSYAYRLTSGDWVWAMNTEFVDGNGQTNFTGLRAEEVELGEYIHFEGDGSPAAYIGYDAASKSLTLTFYDTNMTLPATGFSSKFVTGASVQTIENGVQLTLNTTGIWGYNIEYENGQTKLFLKRVPTVSSTPGRPLEGVHIMLDPGHGEGNTTGYGAVGIAGEDGYPHEHHINYALAEAIAYRLQQLGATVTLTRDQNSTTIDERYVLQNTLKPDFFISVHHDGLDGNQDLSQINKIFGIYYHPYNIPASEQFAQNLMTSVGATTGRAVEETPRWGSVNYGVIRTTVCPSVLFEYGLIVNPQQYYEATSADGLYAAAVGTADGILATLQQVSGSITPQSQSAPPAETTSGSEAQAAAVAALPPAQMSFTQAPAKRRKAL